MERRRRDGDDELAIEFGARVRGHRVRLGWSQEVLAERADVHRTYVGLLETGRSAPTLPTIVRFAQALGIDPGDLIAGIGTSSDQLGTSDTA